MNRMEVSKDGRALGSVTTLRDRTELADLERELGSFRSTTELLRAQAHEFANQLHTISGLLHLEEYDEVVRFVDGVRMSRTALYDEVTSRVADATVAALLADAREKIRAEAGTVFVREGTTLRFAASYNDVLAARLGDSAAQQQLTSYGLPLNERSIASYVVLTHTPVNIADAYDIAPGAPYTFNPQWDRRNEYRTRSILALPLRDADGHVFGVLQLINPPGGFAFSEALVRQAGVLLADWAPRFGRRR